MAITIQDSIKEVKGQYFITEGLLIFGKKEHPNLWGCMSGEAPYWDAEVEPEYARPLREIPETKAEIKASILEAKAARVEETPETKG